MSRRCEVRVRFCRPPAEIARYFTTFYLAEIALADGGRAADYLHPEWGNLRFSSGDCPDATGAGGAAVSGARFTATGPSDRAMRFELGSTRMWGVGLLPLGWAKFVAAPAASLVNMPIDGDRHPAFASFRDLSETLFGPEPDPEAELARLCGHFLARANGTLPDEERILAIHAAMVDPELNTVGALAERVGASPRTLERICHRAFGFSPKRLMRLHRFMRSLSQFMLDPSLKWIGALDWRYHDQAQFVREFRQFMGMTPREYAAMEHPVLGAFVRERARVVGLAVQALDGPRGGAVRD